MASGSGSGAGSGSNPNLITWMPTQGYPPETTTPQPPNSPPSPTNLEGFNYLPQVPIPTEPIATPAYNPDYGSTSTYDIANLLQQIQTALDGVQTCKQYVANEINTKCTGCTQSITSSQNYIVQKISEQIERSTDCYNSCQHNLAVQISSIAGAAQEAANYQPVSQQTEAPQPTLGEQIQEALAITVSPGPMGVENPNAPLPQVELPPVTLQAPSEGAIGGGGQVPLIPLQPIPPIPNTTCPPPSIPCDKWDGFCNVDEGDILVVHNNEQVPVYPYIWVGTFPTEKEASDAAEAFCGGKEKIKPKRPGVVIAPVGAGAESIACDLNDFLSKTNLRRFFSDLTIQQIQSQLHDTISNAAGMLMQPVGAADPVAGAVLGVAQGWFKGPALVSETVIPKLVELLGCLDPLFLDVTKMASILKYWERVSGVDFSSFRKIYDYTMNIQCRQMHLSPGEGLAAFLADAITPTQLDLIWGIHNLCHTDMEWAICAQKAKPVPGELAAMRRRCIIEPAEFNKSMRRLGYLEQDTVDNLFKLTEEVPPVQDIIRFMVRDADDTDIVNALGMDDLFDHKFGPQLKKWSEYRGIPEEMMKYEWRSHWNIPGPSQLFTFWQRLRRNPDFGTPEEQRADIEKALIHNDILPHWFKHYFATQYNPLGQRQLRQSYRLGKLKDDKLSDGFAALGYNDEDSDTLTATAKQEKLTAAQGLREVRQWLTFNRDGSSLKEKLTDYGFDSDEIQEIMTEAEQGFSRSEPAKAFVAGELNRDALQQELGGWGVSENGVALIVARLGYIVHTTPSIDDYAIGTKDRAEAEQAATEYGVEPARSKFLLDNIDRKLKHGTLANCIKNIRRKLDLGEYDTDEAVDALVRQEITPTRANLLVQGWVCERGTRGKQPATNKLCEWLGNGTITPSDFLARLKKVGWDEGDAMNILGDCFGKQNKEQSKRAAQEAKDKAKQVAAQQKAADKAAKLIENANKQLAKNADIAIKAKSRRERQYNKALATLQSKTTCTPQAAIAALDGSLSSIRRLYNLSLDEALQVLVTISEGLKTGDDCSLFTERVNDAAQAMVAAQLDVDLSAFIPPSSNGSSQPSAS